MTALCRPCIERMAVSAELRLLQPDPPRGELDPVVRLHGGDPEVAGTVRAVELAGRDDDPRALGEIARGRPGVAATGTQR